jgi:glycolate oxidase iron-sulfur subunit
VTRASEDRPTSDRSATPRQGEPVAATDVSSPPPDLAALTDLCVKCGLCLPHCPTYGLSRQEGDSPRGRIALIQGLAAGRLEVDDRLAEHLGGCLTCRTCESVCPARVPYGQIIDQGKALLRDAGREPDPAIRAVTRLARSRAASGLALRVARFARALGLPSLARRAAPDHWLTRSLGLATDPRPSPRPGSVHTPAGAVRGDVSLFLGCIARGLDGATLTAAVEAAVALGFRVHVPADQGCCGALDLHDGRPAAAAEAAAVNERAFASPVVPVLCAATGCAVTLAERSPAGSDDGLGPRTRDITAFLEDALGDRALSGPRRPERVAVHTPCTGRLPPGDAGAAVRLLRRIPNIEPVPLATARCCGAAGHHFLTRPGQADALRAPLLAEIDALAPDRVVSANPGCALHLGTALAPGAVEHPVALLARALHGDW